MEFHAHLHESVRVWHIFHRTHIDHMSHCHESIVRVDGRAVHSKQRLHGSGLSSEPELEQK